MKHLFSLMIFLAGSMAQAEVPDIKCFLTYVKTNETGIPEEDRTSNVLQVKEKSTGWDIEGFKVDLKLDPILPAPAFTTKNLKTTPLGPLAYQLAVRIVKTESHASSNLGVSSQNPMSRLSTSLSVGKEHVIVNCDQGL